MTAMGVADVPDAPAAREGSVDFDAFVAARSTALLRTAHLLTRDHALAEDVRRLEVAADGEISTGGSGGMRDPRGGSASSLGTIVLPGRSASYRLSWPTRDDRAGAAILVYRLVE